jgi:hypothetical protein
VPACSRRNTADLTRANTFSFGLGGNGKANNWKNPLLSDSNQPASGRATSKTTLSVCGRKGCEFSSVFIEYNLPGADGGGQSVYPAGRLEGLAGCSQAAHQGIG